MSEESQKPRPPMPPPKKDPTAVMIDCMEQFGQCEPKRLLIIYQDEDDYLCWMSNALLDTEKIGMLEVAKHRILQLLAAR